MNISHQTALSSQPLSPFMSYSIHLVLYTMIILFIGYFIYFCINRFILSSHWHEDVFDYLNSCGQVLKNAFVFSLFNTIRVALKWSLILMSIALVAHAANLSIQFSKLDTLQIISMMWVILCLLSLRFFSYTDGRIYRNRNAQQDTLIELRSELINVSAKLRAIEFALNQESHSKAK